MHFYFLTYFEELRARLTLNLNCDDFILPLVASLRFMCNIFGLLAFSSSELNRPPSAHCKTDQPEDAVAVSANFITVFRAGDIWLVTNASSRETTIRGGCMRGGRESEMRLIHPCHIGVTHHAADPNDPTLCSLLFVRPSNAHVHHSVHELGLQIRSRPCRLAQLRASLQIDEFPRTSLDRPRARKPHLRANT